jgi:hypothetical protein
LQKSLALKRILSALFCLLTLALSAQQDTTKKGIDLGQIHGNFQADFQYYNTDTLIGAPIVPEKIRSNGFMNLIYSRGNFTAGVRFESYLNVLQGFDPRYKGVGIANRFASYAFDGLEITAGNFYEQFGTGMVLRSYWEPNLGVDNSFDGVRVKFTPTPGIYTKLMVAKQRAFFDRGPGIVRAGDAEINFNELIKKWEDSKFKLTIGGSAVSIYQKDEDPIYILPENQAAFGGRMNIGYGKFNLYGEYAYKMNAPSATNGFIYRPGQSLLLNASYSQKGFSLLVGVKRLDNMDYRSDRTATLTNLTTNFLPALTRQHVYNLAATIYPYGTLPNGEMAFQTDISYKIKKGTKLGGKYGTDLTLNIAGVNDIVRTAAPNDTFGYNSRFFDVSKTVLFRDINFEISHKWNKDFKTTLMYMYFAYNKDIVQFQNYASNVYGTIHGHIVVADINYKFSKKVGLHAELQNLYTKQDLGSWAMILAEVSFAPHWFVAVLDQYNYGNYDKNQRIHYVTGSVIYTRGAHRFAATYGRQRAGIFCVGGVCRNVPASNGLTLSVSTSF